MILSAALKQRVPSLTVTLTFHMELVNYGFDTRYADITLYVITLRHIPWGGVDPGFWIPIFSRIPDS